MMFITEPPLTRHLSNAQLEDLRNAPLVYPPPGLEGLISLLES